MPGEKRLVGYITAAEKYNKIHLTAFLRSRLPAFMIPDLWIELKEFPLTPNGKIDRRSLPEPDEVGQLKRAYQPPSGPVESSLVAIWENLLNQSNVGVADNFFELGGHSLLAN